ncbi:TetR/AcrR family transcriptional regulator [Streptococcus halotolerans]|uniref:TetR/AcrR family transcriptional regulator n=1 Tax=Streptococcus halotolerans TaxID=1814128 RepID=UPI0007885782|nr:TetR/AcrR family transcriptional regulator [Streptococcus halotolerans]
MDKRVIKTKKAIKDAFVRLRQDKPIEKIYVENLCREALINKSTFYRYYTDIYDLVAQLQEEALEPIRQFLLENPIQEEDMATFLDDIQTTIRQVYSENRALFTNQDETLEKTFQLYQETISEQLPETVQLRLSFAVGGAYAILKNNHYRLTKEQEDVLYNLFKRIFAD